MDFDKTSAPSFTKIYRTLDAIEALQLRLKLRKSIDGQFSDIEQLTLHWQEKKFSPRELKYYLNLSNLSSNSIRDRKFHELARSLAGQTEKKESLWLSSNGDVTQAPWQLYTVNDLDIALDMQEAKSPIIRNYGDAISARDQPGSDSHGSDGLVTEDEPNFFKRWLGFSSSDTDRENEAPGTISRERLERASAECTQMQIRCAFRIVDPITGISEIVDVKLVGLKSFSFGLVQMKPGLSSDYLKQRGIDDIFSAGDEPGDDGSFVPFRVRLKDGSEYEFLLENISHTLTAAEEEQEWRIYNEFMSRQLAQRQSAQVSVFASTPFKVCSRRPGLHLSVFGEIKQAFDFSSSNLMIQWTVQLPDGWFVSSTNLDYFAEEQVPLSSEEAKNTPTGALGGWTQLTFAGKSSNGAFFLGYPFSFELRTPQTKPTVLPTIYVQAISVLPFPAAPARVQVLGYGSANVEASSGFSSVQIKCWRPVGSARDEMRRWFFGDRLGSTVLDAVQESVGVSNEHRASNVRIQSRLGLPTETSGTVEVHMNKVLRLVDIAPPTATVKAAEAVSPISMRNSTLDANGKSVVQALNKARLRLLQIRSEIDQDLAQ